MPACVWLSTTLFSRTVVAFIGQRHNAVPGHRSCALAWIIHEVSSQERKDALKGMMNTGVAAPTFHFGASIA